ncbi:MAG: Holliday junction branch migration protein RuvA, partial [Candidatus Puniceispirillum sp.]
ELAEKIGSIESLGGALTIGVATAGAGSGDRGSAGGAGPINDAVSALVNLGYGRAEAHAAVLRAQKTDAGDDLSALIAAALQEMGR